MCFKEIVKDWGRGESFVVVDCSVWASGKTGARSKLNTTGGSHWSALVLLEPNSPCSVRHTASGAAFPVHCGQLTLVHLSFENSGLFQEL